MNFKNKSHLLIYIPLIIIFFVIIFFSNHLKETENDQEKIDYYLSLKNSEVQLFDEYDSQKSSFSDFINNTNSLNVEQNVYNLLKDNDDLAYYELYFNPIYIKDYYNRKDTAKHDFVNSIINEQYYTSCSGICMDEKYAIDKKLSEQIEKGRFFYSDEYNHDVSEKIPVILGNSYSDAFDLNDNFPAEYIIDQSLDFNVIGFFKKDTTLILSNNEENLNDYIMIPTLSIDNVKGDRNKIILLSTQIEGFVHYDTAEDYQKIATTINQIRKKTNFKYTYIYSAEDYKNNNQLSIKECRIYILVSIFILITYIFLCLLIYKGKKND